MVQPAASLPLMASDNGARVIEINPSATPLSASAHACIRAPAGLALPALLSTLMGG